MKLVQNINPQTDPEAKQKLLAGEFNVLACECGRRTQLVSELLYYDPVSELTIYASPEGGKGEQAFEAGGGAGHAAAGAVAQRAGREGERSPTPVSRTGSSRW